MILFFVQVFSTLRGFFGQKIGKFKKMMKKSVLKEYFQIIERHHYQNGKAEKMPVLAGRFFVSIH